MASISDSIKKFFTEITVDTEIDRVIEYVIREVNKGRRLTEVVEDPYVRNRLNEEKREEVFSDTEVMAALEREIRQTMTRAELDFS